MTDNQKEVEQELFDMATQEFGISLMQSQMNDIFSICAKLNAAPTPPSAPIASNDRSTLNYLMGAFNNEVWNCERCGHAEETSTMDSARFLREYLATHPTSPNTINIDVAEYERLKKDSERYAWLRIADNPQMDLITHSYGSELDEAIDKARGVNHD